ncbi:MAG TPA: outer membrane protein assembly factor BamA [Noviherbaspirillum sp.]|nr:outer membrane protein assembly factor BamA [Noviherbaspirillum sp.]
MKLITKRFALPLFPRRLISSAVLALCAGHAFAVDPFTVRDIRVEGIQRTEAGTVFSYLPLRVGDTYTDERGAAAIKALFGTGFFKDVRLEVEGDVLVVVVEERPAIAAIDFSGVREFEREQLNKAMRDIGLAEARIFDRALVERAEQELKRQYLARGLYGVEVTTTVTPVERNRVNISFAVDEGDVARIRQINIIGNKAFSDSALRSVLSLRTPGWFTWYSKADQYSRQKLAGDIEALRSYYLNRGYLEMQVESTQVSISPDKRDIYITININEGQRYTVAGINLEGEMLGQEEEFRSLLQLRPGDVYSGEKLAESVRRISERMGNFGYAFANVNASPEIDREKGQVNFTVLIDPGQRVYVRHINIEGNTRTRDEVVRREFRQFESSWYDGEKIRLSRDRVDRLGYFTEVQIETPEVPGTTDQVDVNMRVAEKPTGNIMIGAGFSSSEKLTLSGSIHQANAFGTGNTLGVDVNTSKINRTFAISTTQPYFTDDGVSRSYEVFLRTQRPPEVNTGDYVIETAGANIRFGVPFSEVDTVFFGAGVERNNVRTYFGQPGFNDSPELYRIHVSRYGAAPTPETPGVFDASTTSFPLTVAWQRDSRDSALIPTSGRYQRANLELAPAGSLRYYRAVYQHQYFYPMFRNATLALNGEVGYGRGVGGSYPVFKHFYAGGIGSVRGYRGASLGPLAANGDPLGGASRIVGNVELQFPFPGADRTLRWFTYLDAGNVYAEGVTPSLRDLRYSAGVGISWISPIGPLKLSFGRPLNAKAGDRKESFQFQIGTGF